MESSDKPPSDFVLLSRESVELYQQFWAQIGATTTTAAPMDFLGMKEGALEWGERLELPAGLLAKFRQRIAAAQRDQDVLDIMEQFRQFSALHAKGRAAGAVTDESRLSKQAQALACLTDHPSWTNKQIAAAVGVHPKTLSTWAKFNQARRLLQEQGRMPRGYRDKETGRLEAYADDADDER